MSGGTDPLDAHTLAAVAGRASIRRYAGTWDPVPADVTERAMLSSAVSRRFLALSTKRRRHGLLGAGTTRLPAVTPPAAR